MLRLRAESRVVEVEKQCSMLEFDLKQSVQKMEQLMKQKDRLEDEVRMQEHHVQPKTCRSSIPWCDVCVCVCVTGEVSACSAGAGVWEAGHGSERDEDLVW